MNKEAEKVVFITELMSSGTLKECGLGLGEGQGRPLLLTPPPASPPALTRHRRSFCARYPIPCKQIKKYCHEILVCLAYLHKEVLPEAGASAASAAGGGGAGGGDAAGDTGAADDLVRARPKAKVSLARPSPPPLSPP